MKFIVESIEKKHVVMSINRYIIKGSTHSAGIELSLSKEEYQALNKEVGPIQIGTNIPVRMPGEVVFDDE